MVIELRDEAFNRAFDLVDETKYSLKSAKMTLCALEDAIAELHESSKDEEEYPMEYRRGRGMRRGYRSGMRMRYKDDDEEYDDMYHMQRRNYRSVA